MVLVRLGWVQKAFNFNTKKFPKNRVPWAHEALAMKGSSNPHQATLKGGLCGGLIRVVAW